MKSWRHLIAQGLRNASSLIRPGADTFCARYLDALAAKRVLEAIVTKTNDVRTVRWMGRPIWQYPLDAWLMQEVIAELRPDLIVETGTYQGGSAYFFACVCDLLGRGEIVSIDIAPQGTMPHPRITYVTGCSVDPRVVSTVAQQIARCKAKRVLISFDSDHGSTHVMRELEAYAFQVPLGSYIHIQDGCIDELSTFRSARPGPKPAVKTFLKRHPEFIRDLELERRYVLTAHPYGWIKRIATGRCEGEDRGS